MEVIVLCVPGTWSALRNFGSGPRWCWRWARWSADSCVPSAALSLHLFHSFTANAILISIKKMPRFRVAHLTNSSSSSRVFIHSFIQQIFLCA